MKSEIMFLFVVLLALGIIMTMSLSIPGFGETVVKIGLDTIIHTPGSI